MAVGGLFLCLFLSISFPPWLSRVDGSVADFVNPGFGRSV
jgi:hypothetical protein